MLTQHLTLMLLAATFALHYAAAGVVDGPCSMTRQTSAGNCSFIDPCLASVQLSPAAGGGTNVTFAAADCPAWSQALSSLNSENEAYIITDTNEGNLKLSGSSDFSLGIVEFALGPVVDHPACSGKMAVTSGTCLLSDTQRTPPTAQLQGPCTMVPDVLSGPQCAALQPCLSRVTLTPGPKLNVTFGQAGCLLGEASGDDDAGDSTASIGFLTDVGFGAFVGTADFAQGSVVFESVDSFGDGNETCSGSMTVTEGQCMYSDQGPEPATNPQVVGPCQMELQGPLPAQCSAMGSCLDSVSVAPKAGGGVTLTMNGGDCYSAIFEGRVRGNTAVLSLASKAGPAALVGTPKEAKGTAVFTLIAIDDDDTDYTVDGDTDDDTPYDDTNPGTVTLDDAVFPCQATLRVTSGTCFFSDQGPEDASGAAHATHVGYAAAAVGVAGAVVLAAQ